MELYIMYLRKSQMDRDFEDVSVEETLKRHEKTLMEFCERNNLTLDVVLKEVVSGESIAARPKMLELLELVNTGNYAGVICMDIDRLSRGSSMDSGYITQVLQLNNCKIVTPAKIYDLNNESDEQFTDMKFMFSRYEHKVIKKRLIQGRDTSAKEGKYLGAVAPYGYNVLKLKGEKGNTLEINPEEAKIVQLIFNLYTEEKLGYRTIADRLNTMHIKPRIGEEWVWNSIYNLLTNEVYIGKIRWKYYPHEKKIVDGKVVQKRVKSKNYEVYDGLHEGIVTEEQFELVQIMRKVRYNPSTKIGFSLANPFAELMTCEKCGKRIKYTSYGYTRPNTRPRIFCEGQRTKRCDCKGHVMVEVEQVIVSEMRKWLDGYLLNLDVETIASDNGLELALKMAQEQLDDLSVQQEKICEQLELGIYSPQLFAKRNAVIESKMSVLKSDIEDIEKQIVIRDKNQSVQNSIIPATQYLLDSYEQLTPKEKNDLWKQVIQKITYYKNEKGGEFRITIYPKLQRKSPETL